VSCGTIHERDAPALHVNMTGRVVADPAPEDAPRASAIAATD
jgi:hypothetical protein